MDYLNLIFCFVDAGVVPVRGASPFAPQTRGADWSSMLEEGSPPLWRRQKVETATEGWDPRRKIGSHPGTRVVQAEETSQKGSYEEK